MAKCSVCGKSVLFGNKVSHSLRKASKMFRPNIKRVRIQTPQGNRRVYVCTSCLRSGAVLRAQSTRTTDTVATVTTLETEATTVASVETPAATTPVEALAAGSAAATGAVAADVVDAVLDQG